MWHDKETRGTSLYLAEVNNFVADDDRRVKLFMDSTGLLINRVMVLGSYAVPLTPEDLAQAPAKRSWG